MATSLSSRPVQATASTVSRIGRFHIIRELGRGTVGSVYLGHDPIIDRDVAIKTVNPKFSPAEKRQHEQQFINEARAAGRLSHANIVTIFEASSEGGTAYIAMEYLRGHELSKVLSKGHEFTPDEVASIIWKIADALDHAHKHEVIHRDVKPANIFMLIDDQPKLVDFSIARTPNRVGEQLGENLDESFTLFQNNVLGTPNYMSPEQAAGRPVDLRTDIYSLGAVMYEMLAGRKPFQSNDTDKLLQLIAYKAPPAPHELNRDIPVVLSQIVTKAMSKLPEKRYQHAEEMALDLKRYLVKGKRARARQRLIESNEMPESEELPGDAGYHRRLFWIGCFALAGAGLVAAILLFR